MNEASILERMCAIILPIRTESARRRAGLRTNLRSFGSDAFGAIFEVDPREREIVGVLETLMNE